MLLIFDTLLLIYIYIKDFCKWSMHTKYEIFIFNSSKVMARFIEHKGHYITYLDILLPKQIA